MRPWSALRESTIIPAELTFTGLDPDVAMLDPALFLQVLPAKFG
jgi:hypothetical protein